ncbi:hypothetical protein BWQ96_10112 [Gracilariopsis chorda]|uniref:Uncharacterized protein n=1 Tax=Gracilariopsis chorda TaxID=448386 RepID=A0A2V3IDM6_9FLOR|nr:hypothetical protein BWQ96_10112 [Gracilariopsis chorda]|eukprot:PXF40174.1 hypothetical protein BWQ96_10112 [Gracilariopsis chorda]
MEVNLPPHVLGFLGSAVKNLPQGVELEASEISDTLALLTLRADAQVAGDKLHSGQYDKLRTYTSFSPFHSAKHSELSFLGFQTAEFALPIRAYDTSLNFTYFSRPGFVRPHTFSPLFIYSKSTCCLLAPLDSFHEQVLLADKGHLKWGWNGDLEALPPSFSSTLAVIVSNTTRAALAKWGCLLRQRGCLRSSLQRYKGAVLSYLTYWTDNGAAYWYRREKGLSISDSLVKTISGIERANIPVGAVEIDSWFYPHEKSRDVSEIGYLHIVPPTGMLRWEPRRDVLDEGQLQALRLRLQNKPLIFHSRHISSKSSYVEEWKNERWWITGDRAHPQGDGLFRKWMSDAKSWGASTYEQDWMVEVWLGVRDLRAEAGRIRKWQKQLDDAAKAEGLHLIWCMSTPADMMTASTLEQIISVRSCDDYRYAQDASILWRWHLTTSHIIGTLGFCPFKDVFMTHKNESGMVDIDGDPNAELEACLAVMSAGPVGIGDRLGRTDADIVWKCCRADGMIIKPDYPMTALEYSMRNDKGLLWGETHIGGWQYILAVRTGIKSENDPNNDVCRTEVLKMQKGEHRLVYDWRQKSACVRSELTASLRLHEWKLWVMCPVWKGGEGKDEVRCSVIGDVSKFATMGDKRFTIDRTLSAYKKDEALDICAVQSETVVTSGDMSWTECEQLGEGLQLTVIGCAGEVVDVCYWDERGGMCSESVTIPTGGEQMLCMQHDEKNGRMVLNRM